MARNPDLGDVAESKQIDTAVARAQALNQLNAPEGTFYTPENSPAPPTPTSRQWWHTGGAGRPSGGGPSGGGGGQAPSGGGGSFVATPNIDAATLAQQYGFTVAFLKAYPELNALFQQAVGGGWSTDRFTGALKSTKWYQTLSDTQRKALVMQYTDPATYNKTLTDATDHVRVLAAQMGVDPNDPDVANVATKVVQEGWTDEQARSDLGYHIHFGDSGLAGGEAGKEVDALNQYAYQMGVKNADWWVRQNVMGIVRGASTEEDAKNQIMNIAMSAFPQYADQIKSGMTVESLAQPYMQSMQKILEIPAGQVNLFDPTIRNVMSYKDPSGQGQQKPIWQFENDLRQDPRWGKTQNAQNAAMGAAHMVLRDFGLYS